MKGVSGKWGGERGGSSRRSDKRWCGVVAGALRSLLLPPEIDPQERDKRKAPASATQAPRCRYERPNILCS
jgi:hypothetical protein